MRKEELLIALESLTDWYKSKDYTFDIEEFRRYLCSIKSYRKRLVTVILSRFIVFGNKTIYHISTLAALYDLFELESIYKNTKRKLKNKQSIYITYSNGDKYKSIKLY